MNRRRPPKRPRSARAVPQQPRPKLSPQEKWEQHEKALAAFLPTITLPHISFADLRIPSPETALVIIGNGFDIMHGVKSSYYDFQRTLRKGSSLRWALELYLRSRNLWYNFEESLGRLDIGAMLDCEDMWMDNFNAYDPDAQIADIHCAADTAMMPIQTITDELPKRFLKWVKSLKDNGTTPLQHLIHPSAHYLNFNYTDFLETRYGVPHGSITYIHGCRKNARPHSGKALILGHLPGANYPTDGHRGMRPRYKSRAKAYLLDAAMDIALNNWQSAYADMFTKDTSAIITRHAAFFDTMSTITDVYVLGHSLSRIDLPYFAEIARKNNGLATWHLGYYSLDDLKRLITATQTLNLSKVDIFRTIVTT